MLKEEGRFTRDSATGVAVKSAECAGGEAGRESALGFCIEAARSLAGDKCADVVILDLRGLSQITDYFVIASGTSDRQMHTAADRLAPLGESMGLPLYRSNLDEARANWLVLDFVDAVVHVFMPETRLYYDIESLWGDAPRVGWGAARMPQAGVAGREGERRG